MWMCKVMFRCIFYDNLLFKFFFYLIRFGLFKIVGKIGGWMIEVDNVLKKLKEVVEED